MTTKSTSNVEYTTMVTSSGRIIKPVKEKIVETKFDDYDSEEDSDFVPESESDFDTDDESYVDSDEEYDSEEED